MEFGMVLPNAGELANVDAIVSIAERAEELGFVALWTADHLLLPAEPKTSSPYAKRPPDPDMPILDPLIVLAGVATRTKRIRLGVSVYLAALRHPIVAAKLIASLDQLSNGRVRLGVGAGWIPEEYETMGIDFGDRGKVLDEHIESMRTLLEQSRPSYKGKYFQLDNMGFEPKPVQSPLPIWVGGNTAAARSRVARLGDGWHVIDVPADQLAVGIEDLRARCETINRDPDELVITIRSQIAIHPEHEKLRPGAAPLRGSRGAILDELDRLRAIGVAQVALWPVRNGLDLNAYLDNMERLRQDIVEPFRAVA